MAFATVERARGDRKHHAPNRDDRHPSPARRASAWWIRRDYLGSTFQISYSDHGPVPSLGSVRHGQPLEWNGDSVGISSFMPRLATCSLMARRDGSLSSSTSIR